MINFSTAQISTSLPQGQYLPGPISSSASQTSSNEALSKTFSRTSEKFNYSNTVVYQQGHSNFFWSGIKWLQKHVDLVELSVFVFFLGNLMSVPLSHGMRLWDYKRQQKPGGETQAVEKTKFAFLNNFFKPTGKQTSEAELFIGLRNDISYFLLGVLTYSLPIIAFDKLGQRMAQNSAIQALAKGKLQVNSMDELKSICQYLGAVIGLFSGLITNDLCKSACRHYVEQFVGKKMLDWPKGLQLAGLSSKNLKAELAALC